MLALFGPAQTPCRASATNDSGTLHEPSTRTKYAYDNAGRRNSVGGSFARTGLPNAMTQTAYNENNQLTNWKGASLTYDANGNLTGDGTNTYTWNARNQLQSISGPCPRVFSMIRSVAA